VKGTVVEIRRGFWYGFFAYVVWGLTPLYWNMFDDIDSMVLLGHRIVWSVPLLIAVIAVQRRFAEFREAFRSLRVVAITAIAAALLSINWGVWLWSVTNAHLVEASLGYFITPLVSIGLGVIVLRESLTRLQWISITIATIGVVGLGITIGKPPWIALLLAGSFGTYGLVKKREEVAAPLISLGGELAIMGIPGFVLMVFVVDPAGGGFGTSSGLTLFFLGSSIVTVVPLLMFGAAAKRIPLTMLGLLQYIAPTLQLLLGVWVYGEDLPPERLVWFVVVWIALVVYTYDSIATVRRGRIQAVVSPI